MARKSSTAAAGPGAGRSPAGLPVQFGRGIQHNGDLPWSAHQPTLQFCRDVTDYAELKRYLACIAGFDPGAVRRTAALNFAAACLEGFGLLLLVPLLGMAGVLGSSEIALPGWLAPLKTLLAAFDPPHRLAAMLACFVALIALQSGLMLLRDRHALSLQLRFVDHLRGVLYRAIAGARWSFLTQHHSSELLSVLTADIQRVGVGTYCLLQLFTTFVMLLAYLGVALHLSAPIATLALLTGALLWWLLRKSREAARESGRLLSQANQGMFSQIQEFLAALKLIKIHGQEAGHVDEFLRAVDQLRARQIEFQRVRTRVQLVFRIGGAAVLSGLSFVAFEVVHLPTAQLLVMIAIFARMLPLLSGIHGGLQQLSHMLPAFTHWQQWVARCEQQADRELPAGAETAVLQRGLAFSNVAYRHPKGHQMLTVPRLFIPARKTTAIIGQTGSGKTTFLDLLSGLITPDEGAITVDGQALSARPGWRRSMAYVPQETTILDGTVRENLSWGNPVLNDVRIDRALEQAAAAEFVRLLPSGLDTLVGERGVRLSGGERQRLALARALLRQPELLVLDEATNALDRDSQQLILSAIRALHGTLTVLIVTHRHEELVDLIDGRVQIHRGTVGQWLPVPAVRSETG